MNGTYCGVLPIVLPLIECSDDVCEVRKFRDLPKVYEMPFEDLTLLKAYLYLNGQIKFASTNLISWLIPHPSQTRESQPCQ